MTLTLRKAFQRDAKGNVAITFAIAVIPIITLVGMGVDYSEAGRREVKLNAAADAAALITTTPSMMQQTANAAYTQAVTMFNAQATAVGGINWKTPPVGGNGSTNVSADNSSSLTVSVTDSPSATTTQRNTIVTYKSLSSNAFAKLINMNTMTIGGTSKASNYLTPNIDFYLLLDTSPSMGIAANQTDIDTMVNNTKAQGGCAFACHESNPTGTDIAGNPNDPTTGKPLDNYALARKLGVTLRIDLVKQAVASMISTAQTTETQNNAIYRVATYTYDAAFNTVTNLTTNLTQAASDASNNVNMLQVYSNSMLSASNNNNDEDSQFDQAMVNSQYIPNPGKGTSAAGDTPQEVLMIVTDGVIDETLNGGRSITTIGGNVDYCTPLKSRGVRIAILYTTYNPLPTNTFYVQNVQPFQPSIPTAATNCASPGLFFQVDVGGDITAAMNALFQKVVSTAHLTQ